jgi:choline kinase
MKSRLERNPMKAIILCAGRGGRLRPLTDDRPKCLLKTGERTILEYCLENLKSAGIHDIVIVTGYKKELIERLIKERSFNRVSFVFNEKYAVTNTAVSFRLALFEMDTDFVLINGDVLFHKDILTELIEHPDRNCIVVDSDIPLDEEEVKVLAQNGCLEKIGKEIDPKKALGEAIGLCKIRQDLIADLISIYEGLEARGEFHHYFEKGLDMICEAMGKDRFFGLSFTLGRPWVEIDTIEDFEHAKRKIYPRIRAI